MPYWLSKLAPQDIYSNTCNIHVPADEARVQMITQQEVDRPPLYVTANTLEVVNF